MQVQIKQAEIESAIRSFIANQGISLVGKEVKIDFTAGRKNGGLTADISIEDFSQKVVAETVTAVQATQIELPLATETVVPETPVVTEPEVDPGYSTTAPSTPSLFS